MSSGAPSPAPHPVPALDPSKPTQGDVSRHISYGGQSLFVPVNVWGNHDLYLSAGCLPKEDYTLSPLPVASESDLANASEGKVTVFSQQQEVQAKFHEKTKLEAKLYPYRYCMALSDQVMQPNFMRENPQIGLTPDRAAAVVVPSSPPLSPFPFQTPALFDKFHVCMACVGVGVGVGACDCSAICAAHYFLLSCVK